jgi:hypothetical protein
MADSVKKNDGTNMRFSACQSWLYCITNKFGTLSLRIAPIIALYPASGTRCSFHLLLLFN